MGDGFPVRTLFSHQSHGASISPFLLLDYAGPAEFPPSDKPRGVEEHPHKGFETVTIVYSGEVEHRDSTGGGGLIGPGDVQWMKRRRASTRGCVVNPFSTYGNDCFTASANLTS